MIAILPIFRSNKALNPVIASIGIGRKRTVENLTMRKRYDLDGDFFGAFLFTTKVFTSKFILISVWFDSKVDEGRLARCDLYTLVRELANPFLLFSITLNFWWLA